MYNDLEKYGFEVLNFPSNDFMNQEPKSNQEIKQWIHDTFDSKFQLFSKSHVNGTQTSEVYRWLRLNSQLYDQGTNRCWTIPWNYAKFLIDGRTGKVVKYTAPNESPETLREDIIKLLGETPILQEYQKQNWISTFGLPKGRLIGID